MPAPPPPGLRPLLSSFPAPPTHIPASPAVSTPPLSAVLGPPPSTPLPPLPDAPSPVTPAEQIAFINLRKSSVRVHRPGSQASSTSNEGSLRSAEGEDEGQGLIIHEDDDRAPTPSPSVQTPTAPTHPVLSQGDDDNARDGATSPDVALLIERTYVPYHRRRTRSLQSARGTGPPPPVSHTPGLKRLRSTPALGVYPYAAVDDEVWRTDRGALEDPDPDLDFDLDDSEDDVIDLRTPLPHLMLRAGLLSPHSKLLPRPTPSPEPIPTHLRDVDDGRASPAGSVSTATSHTTTLSAKSSIASLSTASTAATSTTSVTTKSTPPPRDARDTAQRRARHKDGRLLRGGIGLTTGLGWSDSEDEDAPSALTHRLSRLAPSLSRKSSRISSAAFSGYSPVYASPGFGPAYGLPYVASSGYTTSAPVSRASSVTSSPARGPSLGLSGSLGPEGRSLSRSTVASQRSLRRTASGGSGSSIGEAREGTVLPYLVPPLETEERMYEAEGAKPQDAVPAEAELDLPIPDYPYTFSPPSPTDIGHSSVGHGVEVESSLQGPVIPCSPLFDAEDPFARQYHQAPVLTSSAGQILKLQIRKQNQVENRPPAQNQNPLQMPRAPEDRSPTPTSTGASQGEDPKLALSGRSLPPRKSSMPVMGARVREDGVLTRLPRGLRAGGVEVGAPTKPPSKALPPLPAEIPHGSATTPASGASLPQSRTSSGIPKTASMSSLRSVSSRQASTASPAPIPASTSMSMSMSSVSTALQRERTMSNASAHSVRSVRSIASVASVRSVTSGSTTMGSVRARPSLPTPKASGVTSASVIGNISSAFTSPPLSSRSVLSAPSTPGPRASTSPPPSGTPTPRARKRTSSTSSTASGRPLKSAIKMSSAGEYGGGMVAPRVRYVSGASPPVGVGINAGVVQTGIAI